MAKSEVVDLIKKYVAILIQNGFRVRHAFLYGSYLTNTANVDSDIDVLIVTDITYDDYLIGKIWSLTRNIETRIEPYVVGFNQFDNNINSPLIELIKKEGLQVC